MPQQNMSKKLGASPSPIVNRVLQNSKNVQQPAGSPQAAIAGAHNKQTVKV